MADLMERLQASLADRYRIEREIGRGGMATVYLAEDLRHRRRVALKVLDPEVAAAVGPGRFLREIETVGVLTHPHILPLHDSGHVDGLLFYVMPYVEGESLRERLTREKQLPLDDAVRIAHEVAEALSHAHSHGVVHRDIKPENILLEEGHAVVADFGIARAVAAAGGETLTATGIAVGTAAYMSPEQAADSHGVDGRSDLYSLACVLYEMLAGQPPFTGPTAESLTHQHLNVTPRPVTELRPAVPAGVAAALQRALAKTPADRFKSVAEFGEALRQQDEDEPPGVPWRKVLVAAAAVVAVAVVVMLLIRPPSPPPPGHKDWILVAEFDGPADDPTLADAARSLVSAALDQSELLAVVPSGQIQIALQQAGKPADTRVTSDVARELAYRSAVRAVLEGEIARIGSRFSVVLRAVDAESLKVIVTVRGTAANEDDLIPELGRLAQVLTRDVPMNPDAFAAIRSTTPAATPSFEAYRLFTRARQLGYRSGSPSGQREAIRLFREALSLDLNFARAWADLGALYGNLGLPDSARAALEEALRHPERLSGYEQAAFEALLSDVEGDPERALDAWERALQLNPSAPGALVNRTLALWTLGRPVDALESLRQAEVVSPFGPTLAVLVNRAMLLCELGRIDEARQAAARIPGLWEPWQLMFVEMAAGRWAVAESLATSVLGEPGVGGIRIPVCLAAVRAGRGAFRDAAAAYARAERMGARSASPAYYRTLARRGRLMLTVVSRGSIPVPTDSWATDTTTAGLLTRGLRATLTGDNTQARRLLGAARAHSRFDLTMQGVTPVLLDGWIMAEDEQWDEVVRSLRSILPPPLETDNAFGIGVSAIRWALADAYERGGQTDSAVVWLERVTSDLNGMDGDVHYRAVVQAAAHQRLVMLYARMDRLADAERHLETLERWWDQPDDIARRMLDEARSAVRSARGMARTEQPQT